METKFTTQINQLREKMIETITTYLSSNNIVKLKFKNNVGSVNTYNHLTQEGRELVISDRVWYKHKYDSFSIDELDKIILNLEPDKYEIIQGAETKTAYKIALWEYEKGWGSKLDDWMVCLTEEDIPNPINTYGQTKLEGEKVIQENWSKHYIIRTSWVYSQFNNNFMKTMLRLATERNTLSVINDQIGTPTNAIDLAECILNMIISPIENFGIYNFSNEGKCSWYEFAMEIFRKNNILINLKPIPTSDYPTPATRPKYSVLNKNKIKETFKIKIKDWKENI